MTDPTTLASRVQAWAKAMVAQWAANPHAVHKRPPYRAQSFDDDGRYWVVGSTTVSVLHFWHGPHGCALALAEALNTAAHAAEGAHG